ncbi:hypothetical protein [Quadrisphaera sp. INWT6]|uniref:hypothetical protein n=1 Tax=Quadrisphaera sp. INWT6 TaxID=2596917 RepID=UPI00189286B0|nr:hypothetical protein [Quadrisphaera sp. INWT6]MBF5080755.1 hypothetical protein [Quadrisphaera sp. INWT6]
MTRRRSSAALGALVLVGTLALTACGGAATPTGAAPSSSPVRSVEAPSERPTIPPGPYEVHESTPEELREIGIAAVREFHPGATDEEALAYSAAREASVPMGNVLYEHRDVHAYSEVGPGLPYTVTVHLKGADPEVLALIEAEGLPWVTVDTRARYSSDDVSAIVASASDPFRASMDGPVQASSSHYDRDTDTVTVNLQPWPGVGFADVVGGAPAVVETPGVVDVDGRPARTAVVYVEGGVPTADGG